MNSLSKAKSKYRKEKCKQFCLVFFPADMDLYNYLQTKSQKALYLKELIKKDMKK